MYYLCINKKKYDMKKLNEKEKDLIEAIRNFKAARGWMENKAEFEWEIHRLLNELMYGE